MRALFVIGLLVIWFVANRIEKRIEEDDLFV